MNMLMRFYIWLGQHLVMCAVFTAMLAVASYFVNYYVLTWIWPSLAETTWFVPALTGYLGVSYVWTMASAIYIRRLFA